MPITVMGIINLSPESFFKGSIKRDEKEITSAVRDMQENGAKIVDIGAMSTAPYLDTLISVEEEISRLRFGLKVVKEVSNLTISVDTPRAIVAKEALRLGADMINDVTGLKYDKEMVNVVKEYDAYIVVCAYSKEKVSGDIKSTINLLRESIDIALSKGIKEDKIIIDPAIGFFRESGKNPFFTKIEGKEWYKRDLEIIKYLDKLKVLKKPICVSLSRKSFIGKVLGLEDPSDRLIGSIVAECIAAMNCANIIRTHNVKETMQMVRMVEAIKNVDS